MFALKAIQEMVLSVVIRSVSLFCVNDLQKKPFYSISVILLVAPLEIGCSSDDECATTQACRNRGCVNPCAYDDPCSSNAECSVTNHKATCRCPPGTTGDPYSLCVPSKLAFKIRRLN